MCGENQRMQSGLEWGCTRSRSDPVRTPRASNALWAVQPPLRGQPGTQGGGTGAGSHISCPHPMRIAQLPCTPLTLGVGRGRACEHECIWKRKSFKLEQMELSVALWFNFVWRQQSVGLRARYQMLDLFCPNHVAVEQLKCDLVLRCGRISLKFS